MKSVLFVFTIVFSILAQGALLEKGAGKTTFLAIGRPAAIKINGKGDGPEGDLEFKATDKGYQASGELRVDLDSFATGIGLRDRHMKEKYLETMSFKIAKLKIKDATLPANFATSASEWTLPGYLELHGVEKPVEVAVVFSSQDGRIHAKSKFKIKLSDFAVPVPSFSGITVADEVEINVESSTSADRLTEKK